MVDVYGCTMSMTHDKNWQKHFAIIDSTIYLTVGDRGDEFFEQTRIPTSPRPSTMPPGPPPRKYADLSNAPVGGGEGGDVVDPERERDKNNDDRTK